MPPATMGCLVESAAFLSPDNLVYSYSSKLYQDENNKFKKSLERYCEKMNKTRNRYPEYSNSEYRVEYLTNINEYLLLYLALKFLLVFLCLPNALYLLFFYFSCL